MTEKTRKARRRRTRRAEGTGEVDPHLIVFHEPQGVLAEQYRTFRTNLVALNSENAPRALLLTSSVKGEGKSVATANLCLALAELPELRVVLVDADLRDSSVCQLFGKRTIPGLSELLLEGRPLDDVILPTMSPNLSIIPAGRPVQNPTEVLGSTRISDLIAALKAQYSYVLFDTPPVLPFTDASVLGPRMDGVLMVVRMEVTPRDQAERAVGTLRAAGTNVIGCFLAGSRGTALRPRDYYRYYRYSSR